MLLHTQDAPVSHFHEKIDFDEKKFQKDYFKAHFEKHEFGAWKLFSVNSKNFSIGRMKNPRSLLISNWGRRTWFYFECLDLEIGRWNSQIISPRSESYYQSSTEVHFLEVKMPRKSSAFFQMKASAKKHESLLRRRIWGFPCRARLSVRAPMLPQCRLCKGRFITWFYMRQWRHSIAQFHFLKGRHGCLIRNFQLLWIRRYRHNVSLWSVGLKALMLLGQTQRWNNFIFLQA